MRSTAKASTEVSDDEYNVFDDNYLWLKKNGAEIHQHAKKQAESEGHTDKTMLNKSIKLWVDIYRDQEINTGRPFDFGANADLGEAQPIVGRQKRMLRNKGLDQRHDLQTALLPKAPAKVNAKIQPKTRNTKILATIHNISGTENEDDDEDIEPVLRRRRCPVVIKTIADSASDEDEVVQTVRPKSHDRAPSTGLFQASGSYSSTRSATKLSIRNTANDLSDHSISEDDGMSTTLDDGPMNATAHEADTTYRPNLPGKPNNAAAAAAQKPEVGPSRVLRRHTKDETNKNPYHRADGTVPRDRTFYRPQDKVKGEESNKMCKSFYSSLLHYTSEMEVVDVTY